MLSESARMSSAGEARFRLRSPNSKPREIKIIALDTPSEELLRRLAEHSWNNATFLAATTLGGSLGNKHRVAAKGWLTDLSGRPSDLMDEVCTADLVVMVATPDGNAQAAAVIGEACNSMRVNTAAFVSGATSRQQDAVSRTLAQLRPWALMVVIAESDDYIEDMLVALRA
jgi:hypothetical protein